MRVVIQNQRPGVYSQYDITAAYTPSRALGYAAVVARASGGEAGKLYRFTSPSQLAEAFAPDGAEAALRGCVQILLQSGVGTVLAVAVEEDFYEDALALVEGEENVRAVVCDCVDAADYRAVLASVSRSAANLRERVAYCGAGTGAEALARSLNSERMVLCAPAAKPFGGERRSAAYTAAALAGKVLGQNDPTWNLNGEALLTIREPEPLEEAAVQSLLAAGVTVFEQNRGAVECVRAVTTRTQTGGETDYAMRGLNAILCIDDVMTDMRAALKASLHGLRLSGQTLQAVRSQAVVVLAEKKDRGVIESYEAPSVYTHREDPTVCVVELAFQIAHVVSQIYVTAHIQV